MRSVYGMLLVGLCFSVMGLSGCGRKVETTATEEVGHDHGADEHGADEHGADEHASLDHSGWWCSEHGVPEEECALCDTSLVAAFQAKDDWCEEHNRPESQCFTCHPDNFAKFAARYEAKFGEQPPQPTE